MRTVTWTDERGKMHKALVRDTDSDNVAEKGQGLSVDPPDIDAIDWHSVKVDLHNQLVMRGLNTKEAITSQQNGITGAILGALKRRVLNLY